jgi:hypothetical protein
MTTIPTIAKDVRRTLFLNNIQRDPQQVTFRGNSRIVRFGNLSMTRNMQISALEGRSDNQEVLMSLEQGDTAPEAEKERITQEDGTRWLITEVRRDQGSDCYILIVNKVN